MTANITLGDNYEIDEDGNGNLVIKDSSNNAVLTHTDGAGWTFGDVSVDGISSLKAEQVGDGIYYASSFDGSTPTERLQNAFNSTGSGAVIYLEATTYNQDLTVAGFKHLVFPAFGSGSNSTVKIESGVTWTLTGNHSVIKGVQNAGTIRFDAFSQHAQEIGGGTIQISENNCTVVNCDEVDVTFESGASNGLADSIRGSVTDNDGGNTIGTVR